MLKTNLEIRKEFLSFDMNTPKWIPKLNDEVVKLFEQTRNLEHEFRVLGKKFTTDINMDLPDYYVSKCLLNCLLFLSMRIIRTKLFR